MPLAGDDICHGPPAWNSDRGRRRRAPGFGYQDRAVRLRRHLVSVGILAGRVHHGPFGWKISIPNGPWRVRRDLGCRGPRWSRRLGFAMMVW
jgi:hypothetical protein